MFTVEIEGRSSEIVTLDDTGYQDDVTVIIDDDDKVFLIQHEMDTDFTSVIEMSYNQLQDIFHAMDCPAGSYRVQTKGV